MRMQPTTISLGAHSWQVRPLTLAQVQAIEPLVFDGVAARGNGVATAVAILRVALAREHAEAAANLDTIEVAAPEVGAAMACVLRLGGFLPDDGDLAPGESGAGQVLEKALPASTGPTSTRG